MKYIRNICFFSILVLFSIPSIKSSTENFDFNQIQNLQQELEEANKVIEDYISSLPADEQAEFNRAVDELSQMFESMSEEEFASFLNEMFVDEPMTMPSAEPSAFSTPIVDAPLVLTPEQQKKVENVIKIINDVIRQSNIFLVQMSSSLQASKNIDSWAKKGAIAYWQTNTNWQNLKSDIEKFIQQLYKLEDKDLATNEYKYILDFIADEASFNNLVQLQTNLNSSVPQIEISEMDIKELSEQAKTAIKQTVQYFTESLYMLQLPKAFDAIFEKFSPKAEKYREAHEASEKKANEAAKRPRTPIGSTSAGTQSESGYGYDQQGYGNYDYGSYNDYGSYGGGYPSDFSSGGYGNDFGNYSGSEEPFGKKDRQSGGGSMGGGSSPSTESPTQETQKPTAPVHTASVAKSPRIKQLISDIKTASEAVAKIISDNTTFSDIATHLLGSEATDPINTDFANDIVAINKKLQALEQEIVLLQSQMLKTSAATQAHYNTSLEVAIEKPRAVIINFKHNLEKIDFKKAKITPEKQWAYLVGQDKLLEKIKTDEVNPSEKIQDLKNKVPARISLVDLLETINTFESSLKTLKEKTAQPGKVVTPPVNTPTTPLIPMTPVAPAA